MSSPISTSRIVSWVTCLNGDTLKTAVGRHLHLAILVAILSFLENVVLTFGVGLVYPIVALVVAGPGATGIEKADNLFARYFPTGIDVSAAFGLLLLMFAIKSALSLWRVWKTRTLTERLRVQWTSALADSVLHRTLAAQYATQDGHKIGTIVREPKVASGGIVASVTYFVNLLSIVCMFTLAIYTSWQASLLFAIIGGGLAVVARITLMRRIGQLGARRIRVNHGMMATIVEAIVAIKDLKALGLETVMRDRLNEDSEEFGRITVMSNFFGQIPAVLTDLIAISVFLAFVYVMLIAHDGDITTLLPQVALFFAVLVKLFSSGSQMISARATVLASEASLNHIIETLKDPQNNADLESLEGGEPISAFETDIVFNNVTFGHDPAAPVLKDVNLTFRRGEITYIVGPSGVGKTTLVDLLLRYYRPQAGEVRVNGRNIGDFNLRDWRSRIGYASQDGLLFSGTVRENIVLSNPEADERKIHWAAEVAGADEFIDALPLGYDSMVGEKGMTLSGGQRMRLAIARAAVREPDLVIIDEGTARFELSLEKQMVEAMRRLPRRPTVIIITHRHQSTVFGDHVVDFQKIRCRGAADAGSDGALAGRDEGMA